MRATDIEPTIREPMPDSTFSWEIQRSPYPSPFLPSTRQFGQASPLYLVDQFVGKRPALINDAFLSQGRIAFGMYPSALLDSNIMGALDRRISGVSVPDGLEAFLRFVTAGHWDFNPIFYYLEHFAKSPPEDFLPNAIRRTESLLRLHAMDEARFLETGQIVPDPESVAHYLDQVGGRTLADVAEHRVRSFASQYDRHALAAVTEASRIALIKMVLVHKHELPKADPAGKYEEFIRFLRQDLGIMLAREAHLALHYFCDKAGRLLGIQSNTPIGKALAIVRSTAWDMLLLRFPEILFTEPSQEMCIAYVATQEKQLQELARLFTIERIDNSARSGFKPQVSYNLSSLSDAVVSAISRGEDALNSPIILPRRNHLDIPVGLLEVLEKELSRFCSKA